MNNHLIVPFLMGQRRDGLSRVARLGRHAWDIVAPPGFAETSIADASQKMARMGTIYAQLARAVRERVAAGLVPVSLAGDCMSTLGVLAGLQQAGRPPQRILWLDAHGDFHTWATTQTKYLGGMPLALLAGRGDRRRDKRDVIGPFLEEIGVQPFPEQRILLSDARDLDPGEAEAIRASAIVTCAFGEIVGRLDPDERLYVHWDTDIVSAEADMPALKYHVRRGPDRNDMRTLFRALRGMDIAAVSVSAWHEERDADNRTALACLELLDELGELDGQALAEAWR